MQSLQCSSTVTVMERMFCMVKGNRDNNLTRQKLAIWKQILLNVALKKSSSNANFGDLWIFGITIISLNL
jgi:hypothetical protein